MARATANAIRLRVIAGASIKTAQAVLDPTAELVFACALYLVLERRSSVQRNVLAALLWPGATDEVAAHRLRQTLLKLRRLGFAVVSSDKRQLSVAALEITSDVDGMDFTLAGLSKLPALSILPGYFPEFSAPFAEWVESRRQEMVAAVSRPLLTMLAQSRSLAQWSEVELLARKLLELSPWNEEATLALAEAMAMRGEKIGGVAVLDTYLAEVGREQTDLRVSALTLRRRISDRITTGPQSVLPDVAMVGRGPIMRRLATILGGIAEGAGRVCVVRGDAGIGKTRIISEFLAFASLKGLAVHRIHCRASDSGHSLAMLLELIALLRSARGAIGASPETLKYLDALSRHRPDVSSPTPVSPSTEGSSQLTYALVDLLEAISEESPMVLTVEDVHWADEASLTTLASVASRTANSPILFVLTSRQSLNGFHGYRRESMDDLEIPPLSDAASSELIVAITEQRGRSIDDGYRDWCVRVAEGNPYFVQELANQWLESGNQRLAPASLTSVLEQRLTLLSPEALQILQTCALLENNATLDNIEAVLGYKPHALLKGLNELAKGAMLVSVGAEGAANVGKPRFLTRHDLLSKTALLQLAPAATVYLHRRAALVLEPADGETQDAAQLWSCAKHWQLAGDSAHALRLAISCANHLLQAGLPGEASSAFEKALPYCGSDAEQLSLLRLQAVAFYNASDLQSVLEVAKRVRGLERRLGAAKDSGHDELELMELRSEWQLLNWNDTLEKALVCLHCESASPSHRVEAGVMALMLIGLNTVRGDHADHFHRILTIAETAPVPPHLLVQAIMVYHTSWGELSQAVDAARQLITEQQSRGNVGDLFRALCNAGVTFRAAGLTDEAAASFHEALELADIHHLDLAKARVIPLLANMSLEIGKTDDAARWLELLKDSPVAANDRLVDHDIRGIGARLALLNGKPEEARDLWRREADRAQTDPVIHRRTYNAALQVAIELGLFGRASTASVRTLEQAHLETRANVYQAFATFALYAGLVSLGESARAELLKDEYLTTYRREPTPAPTHLLDSLLMYSSDRTNTNNGPVTTESR